MPDPQERRRRMVVGGIVGAVGMLGVAIGLMVMIGNDPLAPPLWLMLGFAVVSGVLGGIVAGRFWPD